MESGSGAGNCSAVFAQARLHITERALDLAELTYDAEMSDLSGVLSLCGEISAELVDIVSTTQSNDPEEKRWRAVFEEASDKVVLMSMEDDQRSAADAVSILLQLRRDLDFLSLRKA